MIQLKPIKEQVVLLFGASSGIGRETAVQFARRGAKVVVTARNQKGVDSLVEEIRQFGGQAIGLAADTSDFQQVKMVADRAMQEYGHLDTWVHLAAVSIYATFEQTKPEEFKQIIEVNLIGQAYGAMAALPYLKREGRGALIHISSVEAKRALPYQSAYAASKHGLDGMLEALRMELQQEGVPVSVTNIMPASINTPFFNKARTRLGVKPKGVPPIYQPSIVAQAILYAAEHPTRDLFVGGAGKVIDMGQRLSPKLMDLFIRLTSFKGQRTKEKKPSTAPNNLYEPIDGYNLVEGDFSRQAFAHSSYNWLKEHPQLSSFLTTTALGTLTVLAWRNFKNSR